MQRERLSFQSTSGVRVTAVLSHQAGGSGSRPAIILLHGGVPAGKDATLPMAGILLLLSFFTGQAPAAGWTSYSPLAQDRPLGAVGPGQDLWIVAVVLVGTSSILGAVNFLVTIFKMRAPGMTLFRMPILVWTVLVTSVLVLMATPVFTSALIMLFIDRNLGGHFFDPQFGQSAAEMPLDEKNRISHRGKALAALKQRLLALA